MTPFGACGVVQQVFQNKVVSVFIINDYKELKGDKRFINVGFVPSR